MGRELIRKGGLGSLLLCLQVEYIRVTQATHGSINNNKPYFCFGCCVEKHARTQNFLEAPLNLSWNTL